MAPIRAPKRVQKLRVRRLLLWLFVATPLSVLLGVGIQSLSKWEFLWGEESIQSTSSIEPSTRAESCVNPSVGDACLNVSPISPFPRAPLPSVDITWGGLRPLLWAHDALKATWCQYLWPSH